MSQTAANSVRERPGKSLGIAVALAFFLGPIGLFYSSVTGAMVMLTVSVVVLVPILLGLHINAVIYFPLWVVCVLWAAFAAHERAAQRPNTDMPEGDPAAAPPAGSAHNGAPGRS